MAFFQKTLQRLASGGTLILIYASDIAEINDSDRYLFKKSNFLKIGSVEKKLRLFIVGNISKKSENPRIFVIYFQGFEPKLSPKSSKSSKNQSKNIKISKKFFLK